MSDLEAIRVSAVDVVNAACRASRAVIYKHSPYCGASRRTEQEVRRFMEASPDVPVYVVDVVRERELSLEIAARLGVRHESPQVILVVSGAAAWDASHGAITAAALASEAGSRDDH